MTDEVSFIDTNLIVYAYDVGEPKKMNLALKLLTNIASGEMKACISNQILAEFFSVSTVKAKFPFTKQEAIQTIEELNSLKNLKKLVYSNETVLSAAKTSMQHSVSIWDALIAETMKENNVHTIYTENTKDFSKIPGINAVNPFKEKKFKKQGNQ
ncbi:MAG TPA: PIN domain-containing protein [archaeon]|nr:PIN domain-containing protein [archaeon]